MQIMIIFVAVLTFVLMTADPRSNTTEHLSAWQQKDGKQLKSQTPHSHQHKVDEQHPADDVDL